MGPARTLAVYVMILAASLLVFSVQAAAAKLPPPSGDDLFIRNSIVILAGEIIEVKAPRENINPVVIRVLQVMKGHYEAAAVEVNVTLSPPCLPDRIEPLSLEFEKGKQLILCLTGTPGDFYINEYWTGKGISAFTPENMERFLGLVAAYDVTLRTDKEIYAPEEPVTVTFTNKSGYSIHSHFASGTPGVGINTVEIRQENGSWKTLPVDNPNVDYDIDAPCELLHGDSRTFTWKALVWSEEGYQPLSPGTCRIKHMFQRQKSGEWLVLYSNTFQVE